MGSVLGLNQSSPVFRVKSVEGSAYGRSVGRSSTMSRVMTASTFSHIDFADSAEFVSIFRL